MVELRDHGLHEQDGPRDLASLTSPEIQQAALQVRARIQRSFDRLPKANPKYRDERIRLAHKRVATDYLQAIQAIRDAASHDELETLQRTLMQRLVEGWRMKSNPTRDRLWLRLLAEYEVVTDALSEDCMARYQDRLIGLEAIVG